MLPMFATVYYSPAVVNLTRHRVHANRSSSRASVPLAMYAAVCYYVSDIVSDVMGDFYGVTISESMTLIFDHPHSGVVCSFGHVCLLVCRAGRSVENRNPDIENSFLI